MKMRTSFCLLASIVISVTAQAQLKTSSICPPITVDLIDGSVNKMHPESPWGEVYTRLPCFSEAIQEPSATGCAGVFLRDKGIFFYTYRDYIEINETFKGTMRPAILGADRSSLFSLLGLPQTKDIVWDAYQMSYGVLVLFFDKAGKVNKIIISSKSVSTLRPCD